LSKNSGKESTCVVEKTFKAAVSGCLLRWRRKRVQPAQRVRRLMIGYSITLPVKQIA